MKRPTRVADIHKVTTGCNRLPDLDDGQFQDVEMWNLSPGFWQQDKNLALSFFAFGR